MTVPFNSEPPPPTPERLRFTADQLRRLADAGVLTEDDRLELLDGELFTAAAKGARHERVKSRLIAWLVKAAPDELIVSVESTLYLGERDVFEPDAIVHAASIDTTDLKGGDLKLAIEVADTTLSYDLEMKAPRYARCGVATLWVVDATRNVVWEHTQPSDGGYGQRRERGFAFALEVPGLAGARLRLSDIL